MHSARKINLFPSLFKETALEECEFSFGPPPEDFVSLCSQINVKTVITGMTRKKKKSLVLIKPSILLTGVCGENSNPAWFQVVVDVLRQVRSTHST